jgi:hypothetical protein
MVTEVLIVPALVWALGLGVSPYLSPSHFLVTLHCLQEPLPQIPVRHRLIAVV